MPRIEIDCAKAGWEQLLESGVQAGGEADLSNFEFPAHGEFCVRLAHRYRVEFRVAREAGEKTATFRKPWK